MDQFPCFVRPYSLYTYTGLLVLRFVCFLTQPIDHHVVSADTGDYYRLLISGTYDVTVTAPGYADATVKGVVVDNGFHQTAKVINVKLEPTGDTGERGFSFEELQAIERAIDRDLEFV